MCMQLNSSLAILTFHRITLTRVLFLRKKKPKKQKTNKTDCCLFFLPSRLIIKGKERILNRHTLQKAGRALDMLPVYHRANTDWQINTHTLPFHSCGKFRSSKPPDCMSVGCGKKSRPLEETHIQMENKQNAPVAADQTRDLGAARSKCHALVDPLSLIPAG